MSVLDMFASALGAFIVIVIILFPYYKRDVKRQLADAMQRVEAVRQRLSIQRSVALSVETDLVNSRAKLNAAEVKNAALKSCRASLDRCQAELSKTFILIEISWRQSVDVDLHVVDPKGREFYWAKPNRSGRDYPATKAQLSVDSVGGASGGIELWVDPLAEPGSYTIEYALGERPLENVEVQGTIYERLGKRKLAPVSFRAGANGPNALRRLVSTINVAHDGSITLR